MYVCKYVYIYMYIHVYVYYMNAWIIESNVMFVNTSVCLYLLYIYIYHAYIYIYIMYIHIIYHEYMDGTAYVCMDFLPWHDLCLAQLSPRTKLKRWLLHTKSKDKHVDLSEVRVESYHLENHRKTIGKPRENHRKMVDLSIDMLICQRVTWKIIMFIHFHGSPSGKRVQNY